jgi:hypothetical protein
VLTRLDASTVGFADVIEVARTLRELIAGARALEPRDLSLPEAPAAATILVDDLVGRVNAAQTALANAATQLGSAVTSGVADSIRAALFTLASFGIPMTVPASATGVGAEVVAALRAQAAPAKAEAERRVTAAGARPVPPPTASPAERRDHALARLTDVFGAGFNALTAFTLGAASPGDATRLDVTFASSAALQGGDPNAVVPWFQRAARVREPAGRLDTVLTYAELLPGGPRLRLSVGQLPAVASDRWCGLPFGPQPPSGRLSVVVHVPLTVTASAPLAGLFVDEWVEVVPSPTETTAVAFHYDRPEASAPNAIVLAVPPGPDTLRWNLDALAATVLQTLELARLRAVDRDALEAAGQFLPALYFPLNLAGATVSTDFQDGKGNALG